MKITKFGHCCLLLEVEGMRLLTDPGSFTTAQNVLKDVDAILITHEHADHYHLESLKQVIENNPQAAIITNGSVGKLLEAEEIVYTRVGDGEQANIGRVKIEGFGREHAPIYDTMGLVENAGYMIADKFYFPGDNFHNPGQPVDILALPVAGPWMKMSEAIDFAKEIKARTAFGVHDGMIVPSFRAFVGAALKLFAPGTEYFALADGEAREF